MSAMDPDDPARLREAFASLPGGKTDGRPADAGRIFDAVHGEMSVEERRAVVEELVTDAEAAEAWRLARELAPEPVPLHVAPRPDTWKWLSFGAAMLLAVGLGWRLIGPAGPTPAPGYRSGEPRVIASALPQDVPLARARPTLRWTALENARYRVRVLTPELTVLVESGELTSPEYTLSDDVLRGVASGGAILWQVEARMPENGVIVSPTFSVRLE